MTPLPHVQTPAHKWHRPQLGGEQTPDLPKEQLIFHHPLSRNVGFYLTFFTEAANRVGVCADLCSPNGRPCSSEDRCASIPGRRLASTSAGCARERQAGGVHATGWGSGVHEERCHQSRRHENSLTDGQLMFHFNNQKENVPCKRHSK